MVHKSILGVCWVGYALGGFSRGVDDFAVSEAVSFPSFFFLFISVFFEFERGERWR